MQDRRCRKHPCYGKNDSHRYRQKDTGIYTLADTDVIPLAVELCNDNRCAGRDTGHKVHEQIDDSPGGTADCTQRLLADNISDNNRIHRVIQLLKQRTEKNRDKKQQDLLVDHPVQKIGLPLSE